MKNLQKILLMSSTALLLAACGTEQPADTGRPNEQDTTEETADNQPADSGKEAEETTGTEETESAQTAELGETETLTVTMVNEDGDEVGTALFKETPEEGVTIDLNLEGLPAGEYGMHIHEVGKATPPTFEDAGAHFNPTHVEHGTKSPTGPHVGDLPNLVVPEDGVVQETLEVPNTTLLVDGENTLNTKEGTSLIIHKEADDYETQPTGDSGDRMIGGVIFSGYDE